MPNTIQSFLKTQIKWSKKTFGDGHRVEGIIEHIRREFLEVEDTVYAEKATKEWIDIVILAFDGAWRSYYGCKFGGDEDELPEKITKLLIGKQRENLKRKYPVPTSQDEPVEHKRPPMTLSEFRQRVKTLEEKLKNRITELVEDFSSRCGTNFEKIEIKMVDGKVDDVNITISV